MGSKPRKPRSEENLDIQVVFADPERVKEGMKELARIRGRQAAREHFEKERQAAIAATSKEPMPSDLQSVDGQECCASRNDTLEFAKRTRKNFAYIEQALAQGADVHVVTKLIGSLLGLVVFPWERSFAKQIHHTRLTDLEAQGWPKWRIEGAQCETLGQLVRFLRHAVAHGNVNCSSDSRELAEVDIQFTNKPAGRLDLYWRSKIAAAELRLFVLKFVELVDVALD